MIKTLKLVTEFEQEFKVDQWTVNGLKIWPILRIELVTAWEWHIYYGDMRLDQKISRLDLMRKEFENLRRGIKIRLSGKHLNDVSETDVVVFGYDATRRFKVDGLDYSIMADAMQDIYGSKYRIRSVDWNISRETKPYRPAYNYTLQAVFVNLFSSIFHPLFRPKIEHIPYEQVNRWCDERIGPNKGLTPQMVRRIFLKVKLWRLLARRILGVLNPQLVFIEEFYGKLGFGIIQACKDLGIKVYDLQHGIAGASYARGYCDWSRHPEDGYRMMPDGFWCWSTPDKEAIDAWGSKLKTPPRTIVGGKLEKIIFDRGMMNSNSYKDDLKQLERGNFQRRILVSLQPYALSKKITDLIQQSPNDWFWYIRSHPRQKTSQELIQLVNENKNCEFEISSRLPLFYLLGIVDCHVTLWSTVTMDAFYSGVPSVILHSSGIEIFEQIIDDKKVTYAEKSEKAIKFIANSKRFEPEQIETIELGSLF